VADYAPGVTNRAEKPSRTLTTGNDWIIREDVLEEVWHRMGHRPTIDAFAEDHNHHLPRYETYFPSPHASGTNAMALVWHRQQLLHINSPWGMISRILGMQNNDRARAFIVAPRWQSAWWWPTLESMRVGPPYIISRSRYKDRDGQLEPAPRWLTQVCLLDETQVGGTTNNSEPTGKPEPRRTSHPTGGNGCIRKSLAAQEEHPVLARNTMIFTTSHRFWTRLCRVIQVPCLWYYYETNVL